jgi:ABC-type phosphate transport system substrate-binding protein
MAVGQPAGDVRAFAGALISFAGGADIMRMLNKLIAGTAVAATVTAMAVGPALADPPKGVTPKATDVVGVGSDTLQFLLDQFSFDYNRTHSTGPRLYSWDALNPKTGMTDNISTKSGCTAIPRPNGSSAGIATLTANTKVGKHFCVDFARSSRGRASSDPSKGPGGIVFVALGKDAVTWATNSTTAHPSNAPSNLTTAQLAAIYTCTDTNWSQVGGKNAPINAQLPQTSSGTRAFFLKAIGVSVLGNCVTSTAEENEGIDPVLAGPNTIFPYSIGKFIAEKFHSAKCLNATCTGSPACKPTKTQNKFGCDTHGTMVLRNINGTKPTTGTGTKTVINAHFSANFIRTVFAVVRWASTKNNIPLYLQKFFDAAKKPGSSGPPSGWICSNSTAHTDLINYGFLPTPFCGTGS